MANNIGYRGALNNVSTSTSITLTLSSITYYAGDLVLIGISSPGYAPTAPVGWTLEASVSTGTPGAAGCVGLWVYSRRVQSGDSTSVTFTGMTANYIVGAAVILFGEDPTTFLDVAAVTATTTPASTTFTQPSITTVTNDAWLVGFIGTDIDSNTFPYTTPPVNGTLVDETRRTSASTTNGVGGGIEASTSRMVTAGATGAATVTGTSSISVSAVVAIRPQADTTSFVYQATGRVVAKYDPTLRNYQSTLRVVRTKAENAAPTQFQPQIVICM